jgi:hypothetical protein
LNLIHTSKQKLESGNRNFFKRDNPVKKSSDMTIFELDLHNPKMYPYTKFEVNVCNHSRDNEWKPIME